VPRLTPARRALGITVASMVVLALVAVLAGARRQFDSAELFRNVLRTVWRESVDSLSVDALYERAARGLVRQLNDPYAALYSPSEVSGMRRNRLGDRYGGLGMSIEDHRGAMVIVSLFAGAPGAAAGFQPGDRIIAIDGAPTAGWSLDQVSDHLIGAPGTAVELTAARPGVAAPIRVRVVRAVVHVPSVPYTLLFAPDVGYIPIEHFNESATEEVRTAIQSLRARGATSFVLDLRGNGGGELTQALGISNLFLATGVTIVSVHDRGSGTEVIHAAGPPSAPTEPVVVLVDRRTASASEIVAGALQDHDRAAVVGVPSFGKGLVQTMFPLDGGWAVKMTTGRWFTPRGRSIHRARPFVDGHFVDPDTLPDPRTAADAHADRPTITSDAGRTLYGGGGIVPDVVVAGDTLSSDEQRLAAALVPAGGAARIAVYNVSLGLAHHVTPAFHVMAAWRDQVYQALADANVHLDRPLFERGGALIDRAIETQVTRLAFGDSAAARRSAGRDAQLQRALQLLHHAPSMAALLTIARDKG